MRDVLSYPHGALSWLCEWEFTLASGAAKGLECVASAKTRNREVLPFLASALSDVEAMLDDPQSGAFVRLLKRDPRVLDKGGVARSGFDRFAIGKMEGLERAIHVQTALERTQDALQALRSLYQPRFPNFLEDAVQALQINEEEVLRARRTAELEIIEKRLRRIEAAFAWYDQQLRQVAPTPANVIGGELLTSEELEILNLKAADERDRLRATSLGTASIRYRLADHIKNAITAEPATEEMRDGASSAFLGELVVNVRRNVEALGFRAHEALVAVATLGQLTPERITADIASLFAATEISSPLGQNEHPAGAAQNSYFVVALGDGLVVISQSNQSSVRLWSAVLKPGAEVDAIVTDDRMDGDLQLFDRDVAPIFDGLDTKHSAWYSVKRRARIKLVARRGDVWFGRVLRKGTLNLESFPAWSSHATAAAFRVLRPAESMRLCSQRRAVVHAPIGPLDVVSAPPFVGYESYEVQAPFHGDERVWVRKPAGLQRDGAERVARELILFDALNAESASELLTLESLALGARDSTQQRWPLYRIPVVSTSVEAGPAAFTSKTLLRDRLEAFGSIARILRAVHRAGFALQVVHTDAFAWRLEWNPQFRRMCRGALLLYAPFATRLEMLGGDGFDPRSQILQSLDFRMLRLPAVGASVSSVHGSPIARDIEMLLLLGLDLLAVQAMPKASLRVSDLLMLVVDNMKLFVRHDLVRFIVKTLSSNDSALAQSWVDFEVEKTSPMFDTVSPPFAR